MARSKPQQLTVVLLLLLAKAAAAAMLSPYCDGASGQCEALGAVVEEELSRRMLIASLVTRYISYGALTKDRVPCSQAGRSYYGCRGSGPANPYTRGCARITHCYRDVS